MAKVTGKYQLTLPKALAEAAGIRVGDELDVKQHGERLELRASVTSREALSSTERLARFDRTTARHRRRKALVAAARTAGRGWTREELYTRARAR